MSSKTETEMDLAKYLEDRRRRIDRVLETYLPPATDAPAGLHEAMRYSLFAGGKRIRPILAVAAFEAVTGEKRVPGLADAGARGTCEDPGSSLPQRPPDIIDALPVLSAIELIHTYSLVHDDLPAMDDDDYRRGRLTSHKKFGESTAILAGDALLTAAFAMLSDRQISAAIPPETRLSVIRELGMAAGSTGMVGGQYVDIESEGKGGSGDVREETVQYIHIHKTGCMIRAAVRAGAMLGEGGPGPLSSLTVYGEKIGLAFQIADDILDVEGTQRETGKRVGKDDAQQKLTYPVVMGLEKSRRMARELMGDALGALDSFGTEADPLRAIARFIVERKS